MKIIVAALSHISDERMDPAMDEVLDRAAGDGLLYPELTIVSVDANGYEMTVRWTDGEGDRRTQSARVRHDDRCDRAGSVRTQGEIFVAFIVKGRSVVH